MGKNSPSPNPPNLSVFFCKYWLDFFQPVRVKSDFGYQIFLLQVPAPLQYKKKKKKKNPKPIFFYFCHLFPPSPESPLISLAPCSLSPESPLSLSLLCLRLSQSHSCSSLSQVAPLKPILHCLGKRFEFFFFFLLPLSLSSTLSFVLSSFLIGLGLWLFVGLREMEALELGL